MTRNRASAKAAGSTWERLVATYLQPVFPFAERAPRWGSVDKGDLVNTGPFTIECKAVQSITLSTFVDEAVVESANACTRWPVVFIKRRGKGDVGEGYAVMRIADYRDLIGHAVLEGVSTD